MVVFIVRRLIVSFFVLVVATFIMYTLTSLSGDPFEDLYGITNVADRERRIDARSDLLMLDKTIPERYLVWLAGVLGYLLPFVKGTLGTNIQGQDVATLLGQALSATLQLVLAATVLAIITGVTIGIVSALRQYSAFDYSITLTSFLFFSLPIFWVAILLKQYGAIRLNTWLNDPVITAPWLVGLSLLSALFWTAVLGGRATRRRLVVFGVALVGTAGLLVYLSAVRWFKYPSLGVPLMLLLSIGAAFAVTALISGLARRSVLYSTLAAAAIGFLVYLVTLGVLGDPSWLLLLGMCVVTLAVAGGAGWVLGGIDREQALRAAVLTAFVVSVLGFADHVLRVFPDYSRKVAGRPIATIGSNTPNFDGSFWQSFLDSATHIVLPSAALILISFATYTRYTRASMLEVMNQDYVRTARSKGLTERTVVMRHAFRNALIPVTTLMAFDFAGVLGGAVITETVFGWRGMGNLFITGLRPVPDPAPVMGFFLVVGAAVVIFNLIADIAYAFLDPRIRLS
ncbi:MAG: ABC transporter permease [Actinomycetes bacterium]